MSGAKELEVGFPEMRYDITMPFFEGKVKIDGVVLKPGKISSMVFADSPQLREGDFGLCDLAVCILIVSWQSLLKRNCLNLLTGLVRRKSPTVDVKVLRVMAGN